MSVLVYNVCSYHLTVYVYLTLLSVYATRLPLRPSRFYSVSSSLHRLLRLFATEVTTKAKEIVGSDPLISPGEVCVKVCMGVKVWVCDCEYVGR